MDARVTDVLLGVGIALGVAVVISADWHGYAQQSVLAYGFAAGFGVLMVWRRRIPRLVLALTVLGIFAYYALDYPPIGIALPAVAALYSGAEQRHARAAVIAGAVLTAVAAYFRVSEGQPTAYLISYELINNIALIAAAIALGVSVRLHRESRQQAERITALTAAAAAQRAREQGQAERVQIARDLHDVVGHTLAAVTVHAHVAAEAIGSDDAAARRAVEQIQTSTAETMTELRGTVRVLRSDVEDSGIGRTAPNLTGLEGLASSLREAGIAVEQEIDVPEAELSAPIAAAAYRIVQEGVTNVLRHASASRVQMRVVAEGEWLRVEIDDDGVGGSDRVGHGIAGMSERARLLGGSVTAAPEPGRGYRVRAELPIRLGS